MSDEMNKKYQAEETPDAAETPVAELEPDAEELPAAELEPGAVKTSDTEETPEAEQTAENGDTPDEVKIAAAKTELYDWVQCVVSTVLVVMLVFFFVGGQIGVEGISMMQTLQNKDRVLITNMFWKPRNGDIVIIKTNHFGDIPLVKRVIATEGQTIDINFETGAVTVDGVTLDEPYINEQTRNRDNFYGPVVVPDGHVFVMGDNRNSSTDSRSNHVGFIDTRTIVGKVWFILVPGADTGTRDWSRIGSPY